MDEAKSGKVEYRTDRQAIVHLAIGKTSFSEEDLLENYAAVMDELIRDADAGERVLRVRVVSGEPSGEVVGRIEMRQHHRFETLCFIGICH